MEQRIEALIQEFLEAVYGEDVRRTYAEIARMVCIEAMRNLDHAVEQGNKAEEQGNYAKEQGDYAKEQGRFASSQTESALEAIQAAMQKIGAEFGDIKDIINSTENGQLLLEVNKLLQDMYCQATDEDIERVIAGTYVDEDDEGSIFEAGSNLDIDDIIAGTFVEGGDTE